MKNWHCTVSNARGGWCPAPWSMLMVNVGPMGQRFQHLMGWYCLNDGRTDGLRLNYKNVKMIKCLAFDNNQGVYFA